MDKDEGWERFKDKFLQPQTAGNSSSAVADPHPTILSAVDRIQARLQIYWQRGEHPGVMLISDKLMRVLVAEVKEYTRDFDSAKELVVTKFRGCCIHKTGNIIDEDEYFTFPNHQHFLAFIASRVHLHGWDPRLL